MRSPSQGRRRFRAHLRLKSSGVVWAFRGLRNIVRRSNRECQNGRDWPKAPVGTPPESTPMGWGSDIAALTVLLAKVRAIQFMRS